MRIKFVFSVCTELAALNFISGRALGDEKRNIFKAQPVTSHTERNNCPPKEEKKPFQMKDGTTDWDSQRN